MTYYGSQVPVYFLRYDYKYNVRYVWFCCSLQLAAEKAYIVLVNQWNLWYNLTIFAKPNNYT